MKKILTIFLTMGIFILFLPDGAEARKKIIYRKKTRFNFSDAIIEGRESNPEGVYVVIPIQKNFRSLFRLRRNFHKEMIRDTLLLK